MLKLVRGHLAAVMMASAVLASSAVATAQAVNPAAVQLFEDGRKLMAAGKYAEACPKFEESARLTAGVGTLMNLAKCYQALGRTASAWSAYKEAGFLAKKLHDDDRGPLAEKEAAALEPTLVKLQINAAAEVPGLTIKRDGQDVGKGALGTAIPVDPGQHIIEATAPGYNIWQTTVTVPKQGQVPPLTIPALVAKPVEEDPNAPKANTTLRNVGFAVGGVGAAGLVVGGVFGGLAAGGAGSLKSGACSTKNGMGQFVCSSTTAQSDHAAVNTKALVSTIGISAGAALLGTGVILFVVSRPSAKKDEAAPAKPAARLLPSFGPQGGGLDLVGSF
jgi:hypothetical protein